MLALRIVTKYALVRERVARASASNSERALRVRQTASVVQRAGGGDLTWQKPNRFHSHAALNDVGAAYVKHFVMCQIQIDSYIQMLDRAEIGSWF